MPFEDAHRPEFIPRVIEVYLIVVQTRHPNMRTLFRPPLNHRDTGNMLDLLLLDHRRRPNIPHLNLFLKAGRSQLMSNTRIPIQRVYGFGMRLEVLYGREQVRSWSLG